MTGSTKNEEDFIGRLTGVIEANLKNDQFGVNELARTMGMERSTLHRKIIKIANVSVSQFINQVKLKYALRLLQETSLSVSDVAFDSGFHSVTYFSKCFHDYYDFSPGEAKNKTAERNLVIKKTRIPEIRKMGLAASLFVIVILIFLFIFHERINLNLFSNQPKEPEKTVAVLPIKDINQSEENELFLKGLQSEIISNLGTIDFITVISQLKYPENSDFEPPIRWAKKLKINYLIEGTAQTINGNMKLRFLMTDINSGKIVWSALFDSDRTSEDPLVFQNEISQIVRREVKATFLNQDIWAPQTTSNIAANKSFQTASHYTNLYTLNPESTAYRQLAWQYYLETIKHDPNFPGPYLRIGWIYHDLSMTDDVFLSNRYLDTALIWYEKSEKVHFNGFAGTLLKSQTMSLKGEFDEALRVAKKGIDKIPHEPAAYLHLAVVYASRENYSKAVESLFFALKLRENPYSDIWTNRGLSNYFNATGFPEEAEYFMHFVMNINKDSVEFLTQKAWSLFCNGYPEKAVDHLMNLYKRDSTLMKVNQYLFVFNFVLGNQKKVEKFAPKVEGMSNFGTFQPNTKGVLGWYYLHKGQNEKALSFINSEIKRNQDLNTIGNYQSKNYSTSHNLACLYATIGETEKALDFLKELTNKEFCPVWYITSLKMNPMLETIRNTPEFQEILNDLEEKYQKENQLVVQLLQDTEKEKYFLEHP